MCRPRIDIYKLIRFTKETLAFLRKGSHEQLLIVCSNGVAPNLYTLCAHTCKRRGALKRNLLFPSNVPLRADGTINLYTGVRRGKEGAAMHMKNSKGVGGLIITEEVIAKMSSTAAMEVAGVAGVAFQPLDKTGILSKVLPPKAVRVSTKDGEIVIDVFIAVKRDIRITDIAEAVQKNVKETVQNMTGSVVSKVNVHVADIELAEETAAK